MSFDHAQEYHELLPIISAECTSSLLSWILAVFMEDIYGVYIYTNTLNRCSTLWNVWDSLKLPP